MCEKFETIEINAWKEFVENVVDPSLSGSFYFRGHADASWPLESSLYRYIKSTKPENSLLQRYFQKAYEVQKLLDSMTERKWNLSQEFFDLDNWLSKIDEILIYLYKKKDEEVKKGEESAKKQRLLLEFLSYIRTGFITIF